MKFRHKTWKTIAGPRLAGSVKAQGSYEAEICTKVITAAKSSLIPSTTGKSRQANLLRVREGDLP